MKDLTKNTNFWENVIIKIVIPLFIFLDVLEYHFLKYKNNVNYYSLFFLKSKPIANEHTECHLQKMYMNTSFFSPNLE